MVVFREWQVRRTIGGDALVVNADLTQIDLEAKDSARQRRLIAINTMRGLPSPLRRLGRRMIWELGAFDFDDDDITPQPIENSAAYHRLSDLWQHREDPTQSQTWQEIESLLSKTGHVRHKNYEITDRRQISALVEDCYLDILRSMAAHGYLPDKQAAFATSDIGLALISRSGHLISGPAATHRKAAARLVGLRHGFPLRIAGAHRDWLSENGIVAPSDLARLPKLLIDVGGVVNAETKPHDLT